MHPGHPEKVDALIHCIHAAAGHRHRWEAAISGLRGVLRGRAAVLARHDFAAGRGEWLFESPANPAEREAYAAEHSARNPWFISSLDYRPGRVMTGEELLPPHALERTDFYRRYLKRLRLYHRLCGVVSRREDVVYYADILRSPSQPAFDDGDRALLGSILRHLTVSLENHWRLVDANGENRALRSIMDRIESAVFVVDARARVLLANARSEGLLESFEGLEVRGERIAAASRAEDRALREAIAEVGAVACSSDAEARILTISNPRGLHPLVLSIVPGRRRSAERPGSAPPRRGVDRQEPPSHLRPGPLCVREHLRADPRPGPACRRRLRRAQPVRRLPTAAGVREHRTQSLEADLPEDAYAQPDRARAPSFAALHRARLETTARCGPLSIPPRAAPGSSFTNEGQRALTHMGEGRVTQPDEQRCLHRVRQARTRR